MTAAENHRINTGEKVLSVLVTWLMVTLPTVGVAVLSLGTDYRFPYPGGVPYWLTVEAVITIIAGAAYLASRRNSRGAQTLLSVLAAYFGATWPAGVLAAAVALIAPILLAADGAVVAAVVPLTIVIVGVWWAVSSTIWLLADLRDDSAVPAPAPVS